MSSLNPEPWSHTRRWVCIALVMGAQIGLIFAFGDRKPVTPRQPGPGPELRLAEGYNAPVELDDPTLFALPSPEGFSGPAWRNKPAVIFTPFVWSEPPRWLPTNVADLGFVLMQFMRTNEFRPQAFGAKPPPGLNLPKTELAQADDDAQSTLRIEGDLRQRRLLYPPNLPAWPGTDLLTDTAVQVLVGRTGRVLTTVLLPPGSGSREVDQWALNLAKALEFAPLPKDADPKIQWTAGRLVFRWQTVPLPATNAPSALP